MIMMMMFGKESHLRSSFIVLLASVCSAFDYSDLLAMGAACEGRDSCRSPNMSLDFARRNCECDHRCGSYGDCCIDSPYARPYRNDQRVCMPYGTRPGTGVYAIASCPNGSNEDDARLCATNDMTDPLVAAPVTLPHGPTFVNAYCALCNGVDLYSLVPWTPFVNCETLAPHNLSAQFVWDGLKREDGHWGVTFRNQFHWCEVRFDKPGSVRQVRYCRPGAVSACPAGYRRESVIRRCESYAAVVHTLDRSYLNPHCALCNGVADPDDLFCDRNDIIGGKNKFSFALIFDVNQSDGNRVGYTRAVECPGEKKYDPFNKTCRNLVCAVPGYKMKGNRCVKERSS